jgi:hypothetical protein
MAVTIDEMQVDTHKSAPDSAASSPAGATKEPMNFRAEREMLKERELRLQAD